MSSIDLTYTSLLRRLHRLRQRQKLRDLAYGAGLWLGAAAVLLVAVAALEAIWPLPGGYRAMIGAVTLVLMGGGLLLLVAWPLTDLVLRRKRPDTISLAYHVGTHYPQVGERLAHALQVYGKRDRNPERYSAELIEEALRRVARDMEGEDFAAKVDWTLARRVLRRSALAVAVSVVLLGLFHEALGGALIRLIHPRTAYVVGPSLALAVSPGDAEVVRGHDLTITVQVTGRRVGGATIAYREEGNTTPVAKPMHQDSPTSFSFEFKALRDTLFYRIAAAGSKSPEYRVAVIELPLVRTLRVSVQPPAYTGLPSQFLDENVGDVLALRGSIVSVGAVVNNPVAKAALHMRDGAEFPMRISGVNLEGTFRVSKETSYHVRLMDFAGRTDPNPIEYRVNLLADRAPFVRMPVPGLDVDIGEDMSLPLVVEAQDDFGISGLTLQYRHVRGSEGLEVGRGSIPLPLGKAADKVRVEYLWDLSTLNLIPEDVVVYLAEARDNDIVSGPKVAQSQEYRVRFPSIYEIYQEVAQTQEQASQVLESVYEQSKELKERLERLSQQLKRSAELDWGERKQVEEAVDAQERLQQELQELSQRLDQVIERMERNDLVTLETLNKYQELQRLFAEVATPEMRRAMEELQRALRDIDPAKLRQAVEKFSMSQEDFLNSIERTIALLKRLQIEQKLDEAIRRAVEAARQQEEIAQRAAERTADAKQLAVEQGRLAEQTDALTRHLRDLSTAMGEFPDMPRSEVDHAAAMMDSAGLAAQMQQLSAMLRQQNMGAAKAGGQRAASLLHQVASTLQEAQKALAQNQKREVLKSLQKSSHDLVQLSQRQEQLLEATEQARSDSPRLPELAEAQHDLNAALGRVASQLYSLAKRTFYVSPQIGAALGRAHESMSRAVAALEQRKVAGSASSQAAAMASLNQGARELLRAMEEVSSASSALGLDTFLQRLQNMARAQEGINQQTLELGMGGQYNLEQQAAMARLAAQQEALRKSLEELQREMGARSEILGRLDQVAKDMEEVAKELAAQRIDQRTVDRQKRILSRLLDSQRSVRERDFSRKRQAQAGKNIPRVSPGPLPPDLGSAKSSLAEDLLRAQKEGYTPDYLELIRLYFEALAQKEKP